MLNKVTISWTSFKAIKIATGLTIYFADFTDTLVKHKVWMVSDQTLFEALLQPSTTDNTDYETNYAAGATSADSLDDAIAKRDSVLKAPQRIYDASGNALNSTTNALNVSLRDAAGTNITLNAGGNLKNTVYDVAGNAAVITKDASAPATPGVVLQGGTDGANIRLIAVDSSGRQKVDLFDNAGNALNSTTNALNVSLRDAAGTSITLNAGASIKETIYDAAGNVAVGTKGSAFPATAGVSIVGGTDGTNTQAIALDTSGRQKVDLFDNAGNALNSTTNALNVSLRDSAGTAITLNAGGNLKNTVYDAAGNIAVGTKGSAFPATAGTVIVGGTDGTNTQAIATDTAGRVKIDNFDGSGNALNSTSNKLQVALSDGAANSITSLAGGNSSRVLDVIVRDLFGLVADQVFQFGTLTTTATTANQTILTYTVPAGKDLLITGLHIGKSAATNVDAVPFRFRVGGVDKIVYATDGGNNIDRHWNPIFGGFPVKIATAADVITVTVTPGAVTSTTWNATLFGYLRSI